MKDMLVRLHALPALDESVAAARLRGLRVRRVEAVDTTRLRDWMREFFGGWADEVESTFAQDPIPCFVAVEGEAIVGFAAYDAAFKNMFGPTGVLPEKRGTGVGRVLLLAALHAQREQGYAYSIIGGVGPAEYYAKIVGAELLEGPAALLVENDASGS